MIGWRPNREERKARKRTMIFGRGYAKGYEQGAKDMADYLTEQMIYSINQDAVLRSVLDISTGHMIMNELATIDQRPKVEM